MKKNLPPTTGKANNIFQQHNTVYLPKTLFTGFLLLTIFIGFTVKVKAQAPDASFTITTATASSYFTTYPNSTVSTDGTINPSGDYFVSESATPSNAAADYIDVTASAGNTIDSIVYFLTSNGSAKTVRPAVLGWVGAYSATAADYSFTNVSDTATKGLANATAFSYNFSGDNITEARIYRSVKGVAVTTPLSTAGTTLGSGQTFQFYGIKVYITPLTPLPVTFINITAQQINEGITVSWEVASQININQYQVERSINGSSFSTIGTIAAKTGNTNYSLPGINASTGSVYYRVKAIEDGGTVAYSNIATVAKITTTPGITIYPNPVTGNNIGLHFSNLPAGVYSAKLFNMDGQEIIDKVQLNYAGGNETQNIHIAQAIAPGAYQLTVSAPNNIVYKTTVLVK